jgi:hypothetical protein
MTQSTNTVKTPINNLVKSPFTLIPKNDKERSYIKSLEDLLSQKRSGDWKLIGEMLGIKRASALSAYYRVYGKYHFEVVKALKDIINKRNELIQVND